MGSIPANSDAQNVHSFLRWRFELKRGPFYGVVMGFYGISSNKKIVRTRFDEWVLGTKLLLFQNRMLQLYDPLAIPLIVVLQIDTI